MNYNIPVPNEAFFNDGMACCPFCKCVEDYSKESYLVQSDDYVSPYPMIWCEECGARAVLLDDRAEKIATKDLPEELQKLKTDELQAFKIPLAKVVKIVNRQFYDFKLPEDKELSVDEMIQMVELSPGWNEDRSEEFKNFLNHRGITERDDDFSFGEQGAEDYRLHLPVNSYDAMNPEQPYPKNFDCSHDGIYVYLQCLDVDGKPFDMTYWGD